MTSSGLSSYCCYTCDQKRRAKVCFYPRYDFSTLSWDVPELVDGTMRPSPRYGHSAVIFDVSCMHVAMYRKQMNE